MKVTQLLEDRWNFFFYSTIRANVCVSDTLQTINSASSGAAKFEIRKQMIGCTHHVVKLCLLAIG